MCAFAAGDGEEKARRKILEGKTRVKIFKWWRYEKHDKRKGREEEKDLEDEKERKEENKSWKEKDWSTGKILPGRGGRKQGRMRWVVKKGKARVEGERNGGRKYVDQRERRGRWNAEENARRAVKVKERKEGRERNWGERKGRFKSHLIRREWSERENRYTEDRRMDRIEWRGWWWGGGGWVV